MIYKCNNCGTVTVTKSALRACPDCFKPIETNELSNGDIAIEIKQPKISTKKQVVRSRKNAHNQTDTNQVQ